MENLNKKSKPYLSGEYDDMFKASEIASMAAEDIVEYRNSIMIEMERESELEFAKAEGREEGWEKGREEGWEKGREEEKLDMAKRMKANGMPLGEILLYTGLTEEQVRSL